MVFKQEFITNGKHYKPGDSVDGLPESWQEMLKQRGIIAEPKKPARQTNTKDKK